MIMEYAGGGELCERVENDGPLNEMDSRTIFKQIANAISYCHNRGIIHRDLKLENVLFKDKVSLNIKVVDFGIAGRCKAQFQEKTDAGTLAYMAPEVLSATNVDASPKIDIWALGCMLFCMFYGTLPFNGKDEDEMVNAILKKKVKFPKDKPASDNFKDIILKILEKEPDKRMSMFELQSHPWIELDDEEIEKGIEEAKSRSEAEDTKQEEAEEVKHEIDNFDKLKIDDKPSHKEKYNPKAKVRKKSTNKKKPKKTKTKHK